MTKLIDISKAKTLNQKVALTHQWNLDRGFDQWFVMPPAAMRYVEQLEARIAGLEGALASIAKNTCCGSCQEAKLVAQAALAGERREEKQS